MLCAYHGWMNVFIGIIGLYGLSIVSCVTLSAAKGLSRGAAKHPLWQGERVPPIVTGGGRSIGTYRGLGDFVHLHYCVHYRAYGVG